MMIVVSGAKPLSGRTIPDCLNLSSNASDAWPQQPETGLHPPVRLTSASADADGRSAGAQVQILAPYAYRIYKKLVEFDWDPNKHQANLAAPDRAFGFDVAALIFEGETIEIEDTRKAYGEKRVQAIGQSDGAILFVVYTDRGDVRWIISAGKADRKVRTAWRER